MLTRIEDHFAFRGLFERPYKAKTSSALGMKALPSEGRWVILGEDCCLYML